MDHITKVDYEFEGFRLDSNLQVLICPTGDSVSLPSRAFATLRYLVERSGEIVEKSALMNEVWPTTVVAENNLNQCILTLRKVLGESAGDRHFILTVPGRGYKFVAPVRVFCPGAVRRTRAVSGTVTLTLAPASVFTVMVLALTEATVPITRLLAGCCAAAEPSPIARHAAKHTTGPNSLRPAAFIFTIIS